MVGFRGRTPFRITETVEGDGAVRLALIGELDLATRSALRLRLRELGLRRTPVRLDLSRLEFVDASGLQVLIEAAKQPSRVELGGHVAPQVSRLLSAFGLHRGRRLSA